MNMNHYTPIYKTSTSTFINQLIVSGASRSGRVSCIIGRAIADTIPLGGEILTEQDTKDLIHNFINTYLDKLVVLVPLDAPACYRKTVNYYNNRMDRAYPAIRPISAASAECWDKGGVRHLSKEEHKLWCIEDNIALYNDIRKTLVKEHN